MESDIDAIFGSLTFEEAGKIFRNPICIEIDVKCKKIIESSTAVIEYANKRILVKNCYIIMIGIVNSIGSLINVYIVSSGHKKTMNHATYFDKLKRIFIEIINENIGRRSLNEYNIQCKKITFELKYFEIEEVVGHIGLRIRDMTGRKHDFMFIETFGNKNRIFIKNTNCMNLMVELNKVVNSKHFKHASVDVALNVFVDNYAVFMYLSYLFNLIAKPGYNILFNSLFSNINRTQF